MRLIRSPMFAVVGWLALAGVGRAALTDDFDFDDNAATTAVINDVGSNATASANTSTLTSASAPSGGTIAASFDMVPGSTHNIDISASSLSYGSTVAWSFSGWFNVDTFAATVHPLTGRSDNTAGRVLVSSSTTIQVRNSSGTDYSFTVPTISTGDWYHVLVTKTTGNSLRLWLNGTESSTGALTKAATFAPTRVGRSTSAYMDGKIAAFKFYNTDESANVATLYAEGVGGGGGSAKPHIWHYQGAATDKPSLSPFVYLLLLQRGAQWPIPVLDR